MKQLFITILLSCPLLLRAEVCVECFELNAEQVRVINKLKDKGSLSDEMLLKLIKASLTRNTKQEVEYVVTAIDQELEALEDWLVGEAIAPFARELGYTFNSALYRESYPIKNEDGSPKLAVMNFARANGSFQVYGIDIFRKAEALSFVLLNASINLPQDELRSFFWKTLVQYEFTQYIIIDEPPL